MLLTALSALVSVIVGVFWGRKTLPSLAEMGAPGCGSGAGCWVGSLTPSLPLRTCTPPPQSALLLWVPGGPWWPLQGN